MFMSVTLESAVFMGRDYLDNWEECMSNANLVSLHAKKDLEKDNGHLMVLVLRKSGILSVQIR